MKLADIAKSVRQRLTEQSARLRAQGDVLLTNAGDRFLRARELTLSGQTPYEILHDNGLVRLRHYLPLREHEIPLGDGLMPVSPERHRVPVVIVPPLAVNMDIYDLFPERSLVRYLTARGFEVYLIDWGTPTTRHTRYNLHTYIADFMPDFLSHVRRHAGVEDLSLHGWSLGGVFTLGYAALTRDPHVRNMVIVGTPIDGHASGALGKMYQRIHKQAEWIRANTGFRVHNLPPRLLHTPGWANALSFKMLSPVGSVMGYWELLNNLGDREYVINHATNGAFLDHMVAYPGGIVQDMIIRVWVDNDLADGRMLIGEQEINLADIPGALLAFAGKSDTMVTADAVRPLLDLVGSDDVRFEHIAGGHMGILAGSKTPQEAWPLLADWLAERSH